MPPTPVPTPQPSSNHTEDGGSYYFWEPYDDWGTNYEGADEFAPTFNTARRLAATSCSLSLFFGVALVLVIVGVNRAKHFSEYDKIILALTVCQLVYESALLMEEPINYDQGGDDSMWSLKHGPSLRFAYAFFETWGLYASFCFATVLSASVWWIVTFRRRLSFISHHFFKLVATIFFSSLIPAIVDLNAYYLGRQPNEPGQTASYNLYTLQLSMTITFIVLNFFITGCIYCVVYGAEHGAYLRLTSSSRALPAANSASAHKKHNSAESLKELCRRMALFPIIQSVCQIPYFGWMIKFWYNLRQEGASRHPFHCEWACMNSKPYYAAYITYNIFRGLGGFLFALAYFTFQRKARTYLWHKVSLIRRLIWGHDAHSEHSEERAQERGGGVGGAGGGAESDATTSEASDHDPDPDPDSDPEASRAHRDATFLRAFAVPPESALRTSCGGARKSDTNPGTGGDGAAGHAGARARTGTGGVERKAAAARMSQLSDEELIRVIEAASSSSESVPRVDESVELPSRLPDTIPNPMLAGCSQDQPVRL